MVLTVSTDENRRMKAALSDQDEEEALRLVDQGIHQTPPAATAIGEEIAYFPYAVGTPTGICRVGCKP